MTLFKKVKQNSLIASGHLCTIPVAKPLSGMSSSVQLPIPSSQSWFLSLPEHGRYTLSYNLPPAQPAALQSETFIDNSCESTISFCGGGFHPYPAVSIRHLVTHLAWCLSDFKREGWKKLSLFVFKLQKAEFSFFYSVHQF